MLGSLATMLVFARLIANPENHDKVDEIKESL
jgi:hypothetical protein